MAAPDTAPPPRRYPVVILGAGINGVGVFRDLCLQGVDCLLVDRGDYCSGASAAPSRLIHGGLKYLETGEFRLVRQSAEERNILLRNAPHYVFPLETVLPVRSWFGGIGPAALRFFGRSTRMNDRGALITKLGLGLYDAFGRRFRSMPNHVMRGRRASRRMMPGLHPAIRATGIYYEARVTHAERLGLDLVLDALADNPSSTALTYAAVRGASGGVIEIADALTGAVRRVAADVVVNAGGAWIDSVNARLGINSRHIGGNKGSHLVVDAPALHDALGGRMVYFGTADGRVNLLYPFMGKVLIGSTDIPVDDPDEARVEEGEIDYLLGVVAEVFPDIPLTRGHVVYTYCGVRPLPRSEGLDPGAVSRDHSILRDRLPGTDIPVLSLVGGKWTTYRGFSEEASDVVLGLLGRTRRAGTEDLPIGGGRDYPRDPAARAAYLDHLAARHGLPLSLLDRLLARYGTKADRFAAAIAAAGPSPLASLPDYDRAEIAEIARTEHVRTPDDILKRRTDIALSGRLTEPVRAEVAAILAEVGGGRARQEASPPAPPPRDSRPLKPIPYVSHPGGPQAPQGD